jgi:RNA polymerase subunit RPABC4/transcription elongation factor Spt4
MPVFGALGACPKCGANVPSGAPACPSCGAPQP